MSLTVYKASAGSGKTFTLAQRYLLLVIQNPKAFQQILAITFTRKATAEMKHRILSELAALANGKESAQLSALLQQLNTPADPWTEDRVRRQARRALEMLLSDYSSFSISTIDSFCQQVVRAFAMEMQLAFGYNLELDQQKVVTTLVDRLLDMVGADNHVTETLISYALARVEEGNRWDFRDDLVSLTSTLLSERFLAVREALVHDNAEYQNMLKALHKSLRQRIKELKAGLKDLETRWITTLVHQGLTDQDLFHREKGPTSFMRNLSKSSFSKEPGSRFIECVENPSKIIGSKSKGDGALLTAVMQEALEYLNAHTQEYNTILAMTGNAMGLALIKKLGQLLIEYKLDQNVQLMQDINESLHTLIKGNDAPFIYEKLGNRYQHFFLDEFQDTSGMQWDNLRPLVEDGIGKGESSLVVGDVKQSIYRFRGGNWQLLGHDISQQFTPQVLQELKLKHNWRSTRTVIDFNNEIYAALPAGLSAQQGLWIQELIKKDQSTADEKIEELKTVSKLMEQSYMGTAPNERAADQLFPDKKKGEPEHEQGWVRVEFYPDTSRAKKEEGVASDKDYVLYCMTEQILKLQAHGIKASDIAILVNTNKEGADVAAFLDKQKTGELQQAYPNGILDVVSSDSLFLYNALSTQLINALLQWILEPAQPLTAVTAVGLYQKYMATSAQQGAVADTWLAAHAQDRIPMQEPEASQYWLAWASAQLPSTVVEKLGVLQSSTAYDATELLISELNMATGLAYERTYIEALLDNMQALAQHNPTDIRTWLEHWNENKQKLKLAIGDGQNAITIITIHKSKGLEYPVVLMPFANWELKAKPDSYVYAQSADDGLKLGLPALPLKQSSALRASAFGADALLEDMQSSFDALNKLYVATTRAAQALLIWAKKPSADAIKKGEASTVNGLLYQVLAAKLQEQEIDKSETEYPKKVAAQVWESGSMAALIPHKPKDAEKVPMQPAALVTGRFTNKLVVSRKSEQLVWDTAYAQTDGNSTEANAALTIGRWVHRLLAKLQNIQHLDQLLEDDLLTSGDANPDVVSMVRDQIGKLSAIPEMHDWYAPGLESITEVSIMLPSGKQRRPDRVVLLPAETAVIDFKTGLPNYTHQQQVRQYASLLTDMGFSNVRGYLVYLQDMAVVPV